MKQQPTTSFQSIVVLTGAGVSAESGLKTFRDNDGLWENHRVEDVCTPEAFTHNPALVQAFYNARRRQLVQEAKPNQAHIDLANFESRFQGKFTLVTQNVDNLHEQAGSKNLLHMHGELLKVRCTRTQQAYFWEDDITPDSQCPCCNQCGTLRPDIVWFGEIPMHMTTIEAALYDADLFVSIGTSGNVYPAAGFVQMAKAAGAYCVELNLEPSAAYSLFDDCISGPATKIVGRFFDPLIN